MVVQSTTPKLLIGLPALVLFAVLTNLAPNLGGGIVAPPAEKSDFFPTETPRTTSGPKERLLLSPACLPFRYNRTEHDKQQMDYYEELWSGRDVRRPTRISLLHMRKAGGTTLFKYFQKLVKSNRTSFRTFQQCEGSPHCLELDDVTDGHHVYYDSTEGVLGDGGKPNLSYDSSGSTLYVTHVREPVARALSAYKYDKRFVCTRNEQSNYFVPLDVSMTLEDFATRTSLNMANKRPIPHRLWACNSNCYARWVTGMYHPKNSSLLSPPQFNARYPSISEYYYRNNTGSDVGGGSDHGELTTFGRVLSEEALRLLLRFDLIVV
eukprot:CAMPEP_0194290184 /NCGR_PEP_ID=MMETSP0169-20130528/40712_1 /TAXON_ID=218684 /ORGANISM="Corethron pennatum, Strain L29A3" /LENGTH=321 /DNA_ID=CAMNT_0039037705 /DNA_START=111 /DNA_END=1072 /DNA_ORIENTATION=-